MHNSNFRSSRNSEKSFGEFDREKTRWRQRQRDLYIAEKVALLGQAILETLELEKIQKACKAFVMYWKNCWPAESFKNMPWVELWRLGFMGSRWRRAISMSFVIWMRQPIRF
jgi:hypothetical protein